MWQQTSVDSSEALYDSTPFAWSWSALPKVNIREIMIHEPSSFLKLGKETSVDSSEPLDDSTRFGRSRIWVGNFGGLNLLRFESIRSNRFESTTFSTHPTRTRDAIFSKSRQIDFQYNESTPGETIRVDSIESSQIDNIFNPPCMDPQSDIF